MASSTMLSFNARFCPLRLFSSSSSSSRTMLSCYGSGQLSPLNKVCSSLRLRSSHNIIGSHALFLQKPCTVSNLTQRLHSLNVFAAKGYKMKTHKASAKRFRVTGKGKIVRRRAGKQHLLAKKNTKRKWRLSKMHPVSRSDYDNVIGALPYLKVNRQAT
uniref:50S ribosomal protein L35 n=1 Tax=Rhizophora mucronata TaxID=61149 RepID=A0A2P2J6H9_RHIMU